MRRSLLLTVVTVGVALGAAGCGGTADGSASPTTGNSSAAPTTTSAAAPAFDVCAVLPQDLVTSMGLPATGEPQPQTHACEWHATGQDIVSTQVSGYALGHAPDPDNVGWVGTPLTLGAHKAMLMRGDKAAICGVDIALASDVTFSVSVTAQDSKTYATACDRAKALATAAEPKLPLTS